jgi:hypothetical protein
MSCARRWGAIVMVAIGFHAAAASARARVFITQEQALERDFPSPQTRERRTLFLDAGQAGQAEDLAGSPLQRAVVPYYVGMLEGRITGYVYFDTHLVRTLAETVLIRLTPDGRIAAIEILSFDEPEDYLPRERWLRQFDGRELDDDLTLKGAIRGLTGATLSSRSVTAAARRILAIHRLFVAGAPSEKPESGPDGGPGDQAEGRR